MLRTLRINARLFLEGALLSYVALFRWLRPMTYLASKIMMPLASILTWLSFLLLGPTYHAAQMPFALLSALLPLLCYTVAYGMAHRRWHSVQPI